MENFTRSVELLRAIHVREGVVGDRLLSAFLALPKCSAIQLSSGFDDRDDPSVLLLTLTDAERREFGFSDAALQPPENPPHPGPLPPAPAGSSYKIRIHAILCANNDGSGGASEIDAVDAAYIKQLIDAVNVIYQSTAIQFIYDPASDFERVNSSLLNLDFTIPDGLDYNLPEASPPLTDVQISKLQAPHADERKRIGRKYCHKLVLLFCDGNMLVYDKDHSIWAVIDRTYAFSGADLEYAALPTRKGDLQSFASLVAHEIGHYFHQVHTHGVFSFPDGIRSVKTIQEASDIIKMAIEKEKFSIAKGLEKFDADVSQVQDTPPDAGNEIFNTVYGSSGCGVEDTIQIPVILTDGSIHQYNLRPDRGNVMSYFKHCSNFQMHFSDDQGISMRDSITQGNRRHLINRWLCFVDFIKKIISPLAWAWIIMLGALMLTPGGITCIICGSLLTKVLGFVSIAIGAIGILKRRELFV